MLPFLKPPEELLSACVHANRRGLAEMRRGRRLETDSAAPRNSTEQILLDIWTDLLDVVACLRQEPADKALHNASAFLSAFGHVVVGWLWLDQALAAATASDTMRKIRLRSCRYFMSTELPKARQQLAFVKSLNDEAAQFADALF